MNGMHYHLKTTPACTTNFVVVKQVKRDLICKIMKYYNYLWKLTLETKEEEEMVPQLEEEVGGPPVPTYRRDYRHLYSKGPQVEGHGGDAICGINAILKILHPDC